MTGETPAAPSGFNYEAAELLAPTWERRRDQIEETSSPVREWMLHALSPREGDVVLELAAGVGDTGFDAAELAGQSGRLISSDVSPTMLEAARRRGATRGVENVEYRVMDAERIDLPDDSVDGALCRFGFMLMPDPATALAETRRILRAEGTLALAVWGAPERNPFFTLPAISLVQRGHMPPPDPPPAPGIFSMASPERTTKLLGDAGFADVRVEEVPVRFEVPDSDSYAAFVADTAGPLALALRELAPEDREAFRSDLEEGLRPFADGDRYVLPGIALCAAAS